MTSPGGNKSTNWGNYEIGRSSSHGSMGSNVGQSYMSRLSPTSTAIPRNVPRRDDGALQSNGGLRRRSSMEVRLNSIRQAGGVNSFDNFARSWQRAAAFPEITPARRSFVVTEDEEPIDGVAEGARDQIHRQHRSLLRQEIERGSTPSEAAIEEEDDNQQPDAKAPLLPARRPSTQLHRGGPSSDIYSSSPRFGSLSAGFGSYGAITNRLEESSRRRATQIAEGHFIPGQQAEDETGEPILIKEVEREDGTVAQIVVGQSTLPQTVFNSSNVLIGIGLLSLPLAFKYSGWVIGIGFLLFSALVTRYTASILGKCLDVDDSLVTFADLAYISFGEKARVVTSILFSFELIAASVALVVLFADSLDALIPVLPLLEWKLLCGAVLLPLNFVPLRLLSFTSILGILCTFGIVMIVIIDGLIKPSRPGSLRDPATTYLFPASWWTLPLSFGLIMSPWGGHSVFPNIYRDMRHPHKYNRSLNITFSFTFSVDLGMGIVGYLMFGDWTRDEITSNVVRTKGYPKFLGILVVILIAIVPLTKVPICCAPIHSTIEVLSGLNRRATPNSKLANAPTLTRRIIAGAIRVSTLILIILLAIIVPSFDKIMALMGSALCFTICVVMPLCFYLKIFGKEISLKERILDWFLIIVSSIMAIIGTVWAFLPKDKIGAAPKVF